MCVGCNKGCSLAEDSGKVSEWCEPPCLPVLALWAVGCQNDTLQSPAGTHGMSSFTGSQRRNKERKMNFCSTARTMGFVFFWSVLMYEDLSKIWHLTESVKSECFMRSYKDLI